MIIVSILLLVITYFLVIGVLNVRPGMNSKQFFFMDREATLGNYVDTTVAFSLQVAVTIYFVFWGYRYGWSNIFFVLTWCLGIFLFSLAAPKLAKVLAEHDTLASFMSLGSVRLRLVSGLVILASLFGLIYTELFFAAQFVAIVASSTGGGMGYAAWYWVVFVVLILAFALYVSMGGVRKVVTTDKQQLVFAYLSSVTFFIAIHWDIASNGARVYYWTYVPIFLAYLALWLGCGLATYLSVNGGARRFQFFPREYSLASMAAPLACAFAVLLIVLFPPVFGSSDVQSFPRPVESMLVEDRNYGLWALVGFGLANLFWQFSDYTAYHRLKLLRLSPERREAEATVRRSIQGTMLSSPITWSLGILAGMAIHASNLVSSVASGQAVFYEFVSQLLGRANGGDLSSYTALVALGVFVVVVMLSTVDSAFISAGKLMLLDLFPNLQATRLLRNVCLGLCVLSLVVLAAVQTGFGLDIFLMLGVFYSWGLLFGPIVVWGLYATRSPRSLGWTWAAVVLGLVAALLAVVNPLGLAPLIAPVFAQIAGLTVSGLVLVLAVLMSPTKRA